MNPLKLRLSEPGSNDNPLPVPGPEEIRAWLEGLREQAVRKTGPALQGLLHGINTRPLPVVQRLHTLTLLEPKALAVVKALREQYRNHPLPFTDKVLPAASLALQLVTELGLGYKQIVNEAICDSDNDDLNTNMFLVALRQAIAGLGQQLLECYIQYRPPPGGHWGELHRLYAFADRNGLSTLAINPVFGDQRSFTTIQHAYLRVAMLGLTQPNHLMTGQAEMIYGYLEQWTVGCRLERRMDTLATSGDMFVDLADDKPPIIATGYTRFRPLDGRYFDISYLQTRLREMRGRLETEREGPPSLEERMRRDMLGRLYSAWEGRGERDDARDGDGRTPVLVCIGLGSAHHYISGERDYLPEQAEIAHLKPWNQQQIATEQAALALRGEDEEEHEQQVEGNSRTRVSRFEVDNDVWTTMHNRDLNAREQRKAALAKYIIESWKRINHSRGGLALTRNTAVRTQLQVGNITAFRDDSEHDEWRVGVIRWLQHKGTDGFEIGIMSLAARGEPVAVRAIAGAGAGGEYFRSLRIERGNMTRQYDEVEEALLVPAHIYDIRTQLVLNRDSGLQFVKLIRLLETTSSFSLFAYKHIDLSMADYRQRMQRQPGSH